MNISDAVNQVIEDVDFDTLVIWADIFKVPHDEQAWSENDWPDKEDELRVAVVEAILNVARKTVVYT